jgi:hypothetical protein
VAPLTGCHAGAAPRAAASAHGGVGAAAAGRARPGRPPCVVGAWRSDGFTVDTSLATATGGDGFTMTIDKAGRTVVDFTGMRPVVVKVDFEGNSITSHVSYTGKVSGRLHLPPANATTGPWESDPGVDWTGLRVTVDLDGDKIFDNASPADIAKDVGGSAAPKSDTQPVLGAGTYTCAGDKLTVEQQRSSASATWTLHRVPA